MPAPDESIDVFINCPFDAAYTPLFRAIVFAVKDLGFRPRSALEEDDASVTRLTKIEALVESCAFGIHDLSATALDLGTGLPRFNMPLELGLFLGCKRFGGRRQAHKRCLILDRELYRYRAFISDLSGQDIRAHNAEPAQAIAAVRDWFASKVRRKILPGGDAIVGRYEQFLARLPEVCSELHLEPAGLVYPDLDSLMTKWLEEQR